MKYTREEIENAVDRNLFTYIHREADILYFIAAYEPDFPIGEAMEIAKAAREAGYVL